MDEQDARWADLTAGLGPAAFDGAGAQGNDFRSYLANLEQEIRGREAAMESGTGLASAFSSVPGHPTAAPSKAFAAQAFAESEAADAARCVLVRPHF